MHSSTVIGFDSSSIPLNIFICSHASQLICQFAVPCLCLVSPERPLSLEDTVITDMKPAWLSAEGRRQEGSALHRRYPHDALIITSEACWEGLAMEYVCWCVSLTERDGETDAQHIHIEPGSHYGVYSHSKIQASKNE